jgi:DNA-binding MarR family transcriptional regulator
MTPAAKAKVRLQLVRVFCFISTHDLSPRVFAILLALSMHPEGKMNWNDLMRETNIVYRNDLRRTLERMEKRNLIAREPEVEDLRRSYAVLADKGKGIVDQALWLG